MLNVKIIGGVQSGKTTLLNLIKRAANKAGYAVSFVDGENRQDADKGNVRLHLETETQDCIVEPGHTVVSTSVKLTVTHADLKRVFLAWELERRAGKLIPMDDLTTMPPGDVAEASVRTFLEHLREQGGAGSIVAGVKL